MWSKLSVDQASDLFSLGSVMYFMASGRPPFRASNAMGILNRICHEPHRPLDEINPEIPVELAELVDRLLCKEAKQRLTDAGEVHERLTALLLALQQGVRCGRRRGWRRLRRAFPRFVRSTVGIAVGVGCMLAGAALAHWWNWPAPQMARRAVAENEADGNVRDAPAGDAELSIDTFASDLLATKSRLDELAPLWRPQNETAVRNVTDSWHQEVESVRAVIDAAERRMDSWSAPKQVTYP